jgi:SNF2 family DNA or RNA helicase
MKDFNFKMKPYDHQLEEWARSWDKKFWGIFLEMGTGKTKVALDTAGALYLTGEIDTVLIIAPKGVYDNWIRKEIPEHMSDDVNYDICRWQSSFTQKFKREISELALNPEPRRLRILAMNVEALSTKKGASTSYAFLKRNPNSLVIIDESTTIKNRKAKRTDTAMELGKIAKYRRVLTGSPVTKDPMDLFSQCLFLSKEMLGYDSYYAFQGRYAVVKRRTSGYGEKQRSYQQIIGFRRLEELTERLKKYSSRVLKKDCLDLPDKVFVRRNIDLTTEQKKLYKEMKNLALAMLDSGELTTTKSVLTQIQRLQEIACGYLTGDDGEIRHLDNNRLPELMGLLEEVQGKVIIWSPRVADLEKIIKALGEEYGPEAVGGFYGATSDEERNRVKEEFQNPDSPLKYFVSNQATGRFGNTLTEAKTVIYFSNNHNLEDRMQSEDRAHRIGQTDKVTYIDFVSPGTIDEKILQSLLNKENIASQVMGEKKRDWFD